MKTIQDAVLYFNGKWPSLLGSLSFYPEGLSRFSPYWVCSEDELIGQRICTKSEFEAEAKRMGFVNGYEWGKEYPTNGEKPNLPDDVEVSIDFKSGLSRLGAVHKWNWLESAAFRITDERYKPSDTSYLNSSSQDGSSTHSEEGLTHSDWHERGELPPVGVECEVFNHEFGENAEWECCRVLWSGDFILVYSSESRHECSAHVEHLEFRPIRTEREKFQGAAIELFRHNQDATIAELMGLMFDAGFKAPEVKP